MAPMHLPQSKPTDLSFQRVEMVVIPMEGKTKRKKEAISVTARRGGRTSSLLPLWPTCHHLFSSSISVSFYCLIAINLRQIVWWGKILIYTVASNLQYIHTNVQMFGVSQIFKNKCLHLFSNDKLSWVKVNSKDTYVTKCFCFKWM